MSIITNLQKSTFFLVLSRVSPLVSFSGLACQPHKTWPNTLGGWKSQKMHFDPNRGHFQ